MEPQLVLDARATVAEGPVWDPNRKCLWWVDILAGLVHSFDPVTSKDAAIQVGTTVGSVALRGDGTVLVASDNQFAALEPEGGKIVSMLNLEAAAPDMRMNDGKCDPMGRFWVGRMAFDGAAGRGELLRLGADRTVTSMLGSLAIPNGLGWSPDGLHMYFIDSPTRQVTGYRYDAVTGIIHDGRCVVSLGAEAGMPDGLTIDADGFLWVAMWGGGCVLRIAPDGRARERIALPASQVTSCAFGGDDLADLYVTTAREDFGPEDAAREPNAGGLFRLRPGVRGLRSVPFAG